MKTHDLKQNIYLKQIGNIMIYNYKGKIYPSYLKTGNAQAYIEKVASHFCVGNGLDIGGFGDWTLLGSTPINILDDSEYDAFNLPDKKYNYIFSSHCLEHLDNYVAALEYWTEHIKKDGILFLYLPHIDMEYWQPQNNKKHLHQFYVDPMKKLFKNLGYKYILASERDMYWSFSIVGVKND